MKTVKVLVGIAMAAALVFGIGFASKASAEGLITTTNPNPPTTMFDPGGGGIGGGK